MECQRCGRCCLFFVVVPVETSEGVQAAIKYDNVRCPNISFEDGKAVCSVHHLPEYTGSACDVYGNPDYDPDYAHTRGKPCRTGALMRKNPAIIERLYRDAETEELELLGSWKETT